MPNNKKYRKEKRITSFVKEEVKVAILALAKKKKQSVSRVVGEALERAFIND